MGMAGTGASSQFQLINNFIPKIVNQSVKLTKKEKDFIKIAHMLNPLPTGYKRELEKLRTMKENKDYEAYKKYAEKLIAKLETIKQLGKSKTSAKDIVTRSSVDSVLNGLGNKFPELTAKLNSLSKYAYKSADLVNLHQKGKIDVKNWTDTSLSENAEMAQSDVNKIIKYSGELQSMFDVNDNLEDWVKAKLNHACDYVATVRDYLKFYRDEKEAGTSEDQIDEKWTNKYKKTINCSNPKGFSQKAHCRARKLRQAGKHTKSKPVREIYKEVTDQLLNEFNSSMAMGALKQLNNDAKELESMLQPNTQLEDWVKAKLNLAGEYLDDVYHHLDHFGPEGRTLDESSYYKKYWFTPTGKVVDVGNSHEDWIKNNDRALMGSTLVDTYENAINKGYVRGVYDISSGFLTLSNLPNYDFSSSKLRKETKAAIEDYIINKNIKIVATGKGKLLKDFMFNMEPELAENLLESIKLKEGWKDLVAAAALGASALKGGDLQAAKPVTPAPAITQTAQKSTSVVNSSFVDYIKRVENSGKAGYDKNKKLWFPHKSFEGGSDTIGYGHKIQSGEDFSKGITDAQAEDLLKKDLQKAQDQVKKELGGRQISQKQMEMFVDFVFNMGTLKKFPLFTQAALQNDLKGMKDQYKRFAGGKELKGRNAAFLQRFLTEYFGFNYYF
jgi:GH24 family phage-related lysozyme (muramidase)